MNASIFSLPAAAQVPLSSPAASKDPAASAVSGTEVSFGCVLDGTTVGAQAQNIASSSRETVSFVGIPVVSVCTGTAIDSGSPVPAASQDGPIAQPVDETQAEGASKPDARSSSSSQRRPSTDLPAVLGSRSIKHAKCALQPQDGQVDQQQCAVPESPVSTKASKCTSSVDKGDTLPSPQEHPEQSMSLIAPGMAVAAAHASLSVPVHSMPGQTRISSSTTENGIGDTNGAVITSSDDSSSITEAQSPRIVQGARSQLDASSNRLENPSVQLPVRSISRSSNTKVVSELAPAAQGGPQVALSEPSTPDYGLRQGIVHPGACTQNDALPMPPEKVKVAGPTTPESKVSKSASHNEGAHKQSVLTQAEGELATSDTASPQVTFAFVGQKSHFDNAVDHVASSSGGATQASHSPKVNTRAGGGDIRQNSLRSQLTYPTT